jgi:hypothetical protein
LDEFQSLGVTKYWHFHMHTNTAGSKDGRINGVHVTSRRQNEYSVALLLGMQSIQLS